MPDANSDEIAAARHVAYVASAMLSGSADRASLRAAVGAWTVARKRLEAKAFRSTKGGRAAKGGVRTSEPSGDTKYPHELPRTEIVSVEPQRQEGSDPADSNNTGATAPTQSAFDPVPFAKAWCERYNVGKAPFGMIGKYAKPVAEEVGQEQALQEFKNYIGETEPSYVNLHKWSYTHGSWTNDHRAGERRKSDPLAPLPDETSDAYIARMNARG